MNWKELKKSIGNIQLYKRDNCIIMWYGASHHVYWDYTQKECITHFKKRYDIKGKVDKATFCPFVLN
jgi:hypothetical protein